MDFSRRAFLGQVVVQPIALSTASRSLGLTAGALLSLSSCIRIPPPEEAQRLNLQYLRSRDLRILHVLLPGVLGLNPEEFTVPKAEIAIQNFDRLMLKMADGTRRDVLQLFDILNFPLSRRFLGLANDWDEASPAEVVEQFRNWEQSIFALKRQIPHALSPLVKYSWYASNSDETGYPGPPESIKPYLSDEKELAK